MIRKLRLIEGFKHFGAGATVSTTLSLLVAHT